MAQAISKPETFPTFSELVDRLWIADKLHNPQNGVLGSTSHMERRKALIS